MYIFQNVQGTNISQMKFSSFQPLIFKGKLKPVVFLKEGIPRKISMKSAHALFEKNYYVPSTFNASSKTNVFFPSCRTLPLTWHHLMCFFAAGGVQSFYPSSSRASRGRKFQKKKELYSKTISLL